MRRDAGERKERETGRAGKERESEIKEKQNERENNGGARNKGKRRASFPYLASSLGYRIECDYY